jgi:radical SAM superfamily enzyme YgiQ (UPF0313 family)
MSKPLKVYLGDLTYTTLSLATNAFPLNVGFIAAYASKKFGSAIEIKIFKYIDQIEETLKTSPPDILGLSNYPWNFNLGLQLFKMVRRSSPKTICVMGGPNMPQEDDARTAFIKKNALIDFYAYLEGEEAFVKLLERAMAAGLDRQKMRESPVEGFIHRLDDGSVMKGVMIPRRKELDEIPSPYLTGFMDPFFDGKLSPMMETNRGCPFSCTFCHEGNPAISRVNQFSLERVKAELDYIADRIRSTPGLVTNLLFADPNFAMYERDFEIVEHIERIQKSQNWPRSIFASTGKNKKERIARSLRKLNGSMTMWMSVQSMDPNVLKEIKRENIKTSEMMALAGVYQEMGLPTLSEVILGLPGDSYERHLGTLSKVAESGVDTIDAYTCMLLNGTELNTKASREKHNIGSHFRVLPRDFAKLSNGDVAVEIEEVVTSTNTMSFEDYCAVRNIHFMLAVVYSGSGFRPLLKLLRQKKLPVIEFIKTLVVNIQSAPRSVIDVYNSFARLTREELWNSEDELRNYICSENNYEKLLKEEMGTNLIQTHTAKALRVMNDWVDFVFGEAQKMFHETLVSNPEVSMMFNDIRNFCAGRTHNIWGEDRNIDNPQYALTYDIAGWMRAPVDAPLSNHKFEKPTTFSFCFPPEKQEEMAALIQRFGTTPTGIGRILVFMNIPRTWREPMAISDVPQVVS